MNPVAALPHASNLRRKSETFAVLCHDVPSPPSDSSSNNSRYANISESFFFLLLGLRFDAPIRRSIEAHISFGVDSAAQTLTGIEEAKSSMRSHVNCLGALSQSLSHNHCGVPGHVVGGRKTLFLSQRVLRSRSEGTQRGNMNFTMIRKVNRLGISLD